MKIKTRVKNKGASGYSNYKGVPALSPKTKKLVLGKKQTTPPEELEFELDLPEDFESKKKIKEKPTPRKDYCYECNTDELFWVMMAGRCTKCDKIILGGE